MQPNLVRAKEIQRKEKKVCSADQLEHLESRTTLKVITYIFNLNCFIYLIPFYWMVITSFKSAEEIAATKPFLIQTNYF